MSTRDEQIQEALRKGEIQSMLDNLFDLVEGAARRMAESDELMELMAANHRKHFLALCKVGFSEEQAIQIVAHQAGFSGHRS